MLELTKMDQINLNKMKEWVEKELDGLTVDLNFFPADRKGWISLKKKLDQEALTLLTDISRASKNYRRLTMADVSSTSSEDGEHFYFDYFGPNGIVRFVFKKGSDNIRFWRVETEIFEEEHSLF